MSSETRELLAEYYAWLEANPQYMGAPIWRVPVPPHLQAIALAELQTRLIHGDPSAEEPRGLLCDP